VGVGAGGASDYYDASGTATPTGGAGTHVIPGAVFDSANGVWWTAQPQIQVGQGFYVQNPGSAINWSQNLQVP